MSREENLGPKLNAIHRRLVAGERAAAGDLFETAAGPLTAFLKRHYRLLNDDAVYDLVQDALVKHIVNPGAFDPARSSLWSWLCEVTRRDAHDRTRGDRRRAELLALAAPAIADWNVHPNHESEAEAVALYEREHDVRLTLDPVERAVLDLMIDGERDTAAFAEVLGLDPAHPETAAEVKRVKERIKGRAKRATR